MDELEGIGTNTGGSSSSSSSSAVSSSVSMGVDGDAGSGAAGKMTVKSQFNKHWTEKRLEDMTDRDWRIFREDFDIRIQGGRGGCMLILVCMDS